MAHFSASALADSAGRPDEDLGDYRAVSALAVVGLILAILSATAFIHTLLWLLAWVAVAINVVALRRIGESNSRLIGRKVALIGLATSLVFSLGAPTQYVLHRRQLRRESLEIAREWFGYLHDNRPEMAHRMTQMPLTKAGREQSPLSGYQGGGAPIESLQRFIHEPIAEVLLKVGKRAHIRLYANEDVWSGRSMEGVHDLFVVTVDEGSRPISFFVRLGTTRTRDIATGDWQWQVTVHEFVTAPPEALIDAVSGE